ncbi:MAG: hypothetical protein HEEMFOPI_00994 [Holosporales bacterium]
MLQTVLGIFVFASVITVHAASKKEVLRRIENNQDQELMRMLTSDPLEPAVKKAADQYSKANDRNSRQDAPQQQAWERNPYNSSVRAPLNNNPTIENLMRNANNGSVDAAYNLGYRYYHGKDVEQDYQQAYKYFSMANDPRSINELGIMYYNGFGVEKDYKRAFKNFKKAADLGNKTARSNVALCYLHGNGVSQNVQKAINIYQELTNQGYADAPYRLAMIYQSETYNQRDPEKAGDFMNQALEMKSVNAENYIKNNPDFFRRLQASNNSAQSLFSRRQSPYNAAQPPAYGRNIDNEPPFLYGRSQSPSYAVPPAYGTLQYAAQPPAYGRSVENERPFQHSRSQNFYSAR